MESKSKFISIRVNGQPYDTATRHLSDLLSECAYGAVRVATAVNGHFVPQTQRAMTEIKPGDRIEIVSARQGG